MEKITLNAETREAVGKGAARTLRRAGIIPAIVYRNGTAQPIQINHKELTKFMKATAGKQVLINLMLKDGSDRLALLKECQLDPIKGTILHSDFLEVSPTEKIKTKVHVSTVGESVGVKRDGGILQHSLRKIEIECLPEKMPGHIEVDVSGLGTGHSIHVSDLMLGEDIKILTNPDEVIVTVTAPTVEKVAEEVAPVAAEPEVVKKGKKEAEEEVKE